MRQRPCKCGFCGARHLVGVLVVWCIRVVSIVNDKSPFIEEKGLCKPHLSSFLQVNAFWALFVGVARARLHICLGVQCQNYWVGRLQLGCKCDGISNIASVGRDGEISIQLMQDSAI